MRCPRLTIRRLATIVAVAALVLSSAHRWGPRPGLYLSAGGVSFGVCRNESEGRFFDPHRGWGGWTYQIGAWESDGVGWMVAGLGISDRKVTLKIPGRPPEIVW
jgi:hypothetical protein